MDSAEGDVSQDPIMDDDLYTSMSMAVPDDEGDYCRICRGEATSAQPLFYPCKCSGSIKFVHQDCLMEWLTHSQKKYCELCKTPFRFTKLYDQSMPPTLPLPLFLQQIAIHGVRASTKWARFILVGFVWLCWLPWSIRQVWAGLFWLADGSWISENDARQALVAAAAAVAGDQVAADRTSSFNATVRSSFVQALPLVAAPISSFLGINSDELLLVKMFRLTFPSLFHWSSSLIASANVTENSFFAASPRRPSLLSDMAFLKSVTGYAVLDNAILDIFEGQLICLLIITAFILVFLIREWVINQQPALNMPELDRAEVAVPNGLPQVDAAQRARRHRRALRRGVDQQNNAQDAAAARVVQRPRRLPQPRRAATEDNIVRDGPTPLVERQPSPIRSASSFQVELPITPIIDSLQEPLVPDFDAVDLQDTDMRPSLLPRGAFDDAANIHRTIEEGQSGKESPDPLSADGRLLLSRPFTSPPIPEEQQGSAHDMYDPDHLANQQESEQGPPSISGPFSIDVAQQLPRRPKSSLERLPDLPSELDIRATWIDQFVNDDAASEYSTVSDGTSMAATDGSKGSREFEPSSNDGRGIPTAASTTADSLAAPDAEAVVEEEPADQDTTNEEPVSITVTETRSVFEPVVAWLWQLDGVPHQQADEPLPNDEQLVEDINAEPPFVPVQAQQLRNGAIRRAAVPGTPPPEPNVQFELFPNDPNDADAIEDAEDLDGILELIGLQGPIAGMVQNVIFSEFLITLTIAASVWLPYIWGKIAFLVMANPAGVFVRAPIYLTARIADVAVDMMLFIAGLMGYALNWLIQGLQLLLTRVAPSSASYLDFPLVRSASANLARTSGARLELTLSHAAFGLKPDLPTFSMQSHHALRVFQTWATRGFTSVGALCSLQSLQSSLQTLSPTPPKLAALARFLFSPWVLKSELLKIGETLREFSSELKPKSFLKPEDIDFSVMKWTAQDKVLAIVIGYMFFAVAGSIYLKVARFFQGLGPNEKVEGIVADSLRQAGGVMKVIVIIGIEMIVFPLYCGLLLDVALLPLFADATVQSRIAFMLQAPITGLFVHWFIGTCYMFHFALFVSMCRKILRRGVLYFIRDPDDPTFHPVRDVLERPVATQLGKIAFSALIYGGLVILCLGGVVWAVSCVGGVLPVHWTDVQPRLAFPVDVIFFNFLLPFIVRKAEPSKKISTMYEWWFQGCARALRLSHFLFGEEKEEEKSSRALKHWSSMLSRKRADRGQSIVREEQPSIKEKSTPASDSRRDGTYVRAPANDSVRIPKGEKVFLEVTETNERIDGEDDQEVGMHGKIDERFTKLYIPPNFRARIATFIVLLWIFAATTGVVFTVGPLLVGRSILQWIADSDAPPNDLYALTVGIHVCGGVGYTIRYSRFFATELKTKLSTIFKNLRQTMPQILSTAKYVAGLAYMAIVFGVVLPFALSLLTEIYVHVPIYSFLSRPSQSSATTSDTTTNKEDYPPVPPTIFILQTWTLGLLYLRLALRLVRNYPAPDTRAAIATKAVIRNGWLLPDIRLATRAILLPATVLCLTLLLVPLGAAKVAIVAMRIEDIETQASIYRASYPGLLAAAITMYLFVMLKKQIAVWRIKIRDEVYLIGERLHNFQEVKRSKSSGTRSKGKQRAGTGNRVEVGP